MIKMKNSQFTECNNSIYESLSGIKNQMPKMYKNNFKIHNSSTITIIQSNQIKIERNNIKKVSKNPSNCKI